MAGVQGRHCLAEPGPLVGVGCGKGWRKLPWGKQKLWYVWYNPGSRGNGRVRGFFTPAGFKPIL
jgi:hypothetical protein